MKFYAHTDQSEFSMQDAWAKTDENGQPALSVRDHCINVGAVSEVLIGAIAPAQKCVLPTDATLLISAHDIGKITPGFLLKSPVWREQWQERLELDSTGIYESFHAKVSQAFLCKQYEKAPLWLVSVGGHHGSYCSNKPRLWKSPNEGSSRVFDVLKKELFDELTLMFGSQSEAKVKSFTRVHYFTGLMILSDWIGSSERWFPLSAQLDSDPVVTIELASKRAMNAVDEIGWARRNVKRGLNFGELFRDDASDNFEPRPLQSCLIDAVDAPGLYILEAPMGGGKTEAALAAAYRRWSEGDERGLYFALPTQLTSNRIHKRIKQFLANVVSDVSPLSIVHGNAWLSPDRMTAVQPSTPDGDEDASEANRWFTDNRKAMLAPFGTGTIDQALMAVMPVKFSALRLFALGGKVVVIDEVHSYDPYTSALVDRAVEYLLEVGSTVIVLSATLTRRRRSKLVRAARAKEFHQTEAYPLLTKVETGKKKAESIAVEATDTTSLRVEVTFAADEDSDWLSIASVAAGKGACVLVIRNTVALAQEAFRLLKSNCIDGDIEFGLLHSRFPQFQRNDNEDLWMEKLGNGNGVRPEGCILVGTQVLEQSIDIDADLLITDLAPSDLILQRMGRLHRHRRSRPSGFENAQCIIISPTVDWTADEKEIKAAIGPAAYVYSPFVLFQAQRVWRELGSVSLPADIRGILEESERIPEKVPEGALLAKEAYDQLTKKQINTVFGRGLLEVPVPDVEGMETRWGATPTAYVVLLKAWPKTSGRLTAIEFIDGTAKEVSDVGFDFELARALHLNAIRVPRYLIADCLKGGSGPAWLQSHMTSAVVAVCEFGTVSCDILNAPEFTAYSLTYHVASGLSYEKNENVRVDYYDEEDSWY